MTPPAAPAFPNPSQFLSSSPTSGGIPITSNSQEDSYENDKPAVERIYDHIRLCGKQGATASQISVGTKQPLELVRELLEDLLDDKRVFKYHEKLADWYTSVPLSESFIYSETHRPFPCPRCHETYKTKENLEKHLETCPKGDPRFKSKQLPLTESDQVSGKPKCCPCCQKDLSKLDNMHKKQHMMDVHKSTRDEAIEVLRKAGLIEGAVDLDDLLKEDKPVPEASAPVSEPVQVPTGTCSFCGKEMPTPGKARMHEKLCGKNPDSNRCKNSHVVKKAGEHEVKEALKPTGEPKMTVKEAAEKIPQISDALKAMGDCSISETTNEVEIFPPFYAIDRAGQVVVVEDKQSSPKLKPSEYALFRDLLEHAEQIAAEGGLDMSATMCICLGVGEKPSRRLTIHMGAN